MEAAKTSLARIMTSVEHLGFLAKNASAEAMTEAEKADKSEAEKFIERFDNAMDDDLNTADAISVLFELVKFVNTKADEQSSREFLEAMKAEIILLSDILGIKVEKKEELLDADIEALIEERQAARKNKEAQHSY